MANFANDCQKDLSKAIATAERTMKRAMAGLNTCTGEDEYVETVHMIELLKENIATWKGDDPSEIKHQGFF